MGGGTGLRQGTGLTAKARSPLRALAALVLLIGAGCGSAEPELLDRAALERSIPVALVPTAPHLVEQVSRPVMAAATLATVSCSVTISGYPMSVAVTGPDPFGGVRVASPATVVWASDVAEQAVARLDADLGVSNRMTCRPEARIARAGQIFDCTVLGPDGRTHRLVATLVDTTGLFRLDAPSG